MSSPPKYHTAAEEEEGLLSVEHAYPPAGDSQQSSASSGLNADDMSIAFFFRPVYPLTLSVEAADAMGLLPRSRQEALRAAKEAFPILRSIDDDRILFTVPSELSIVGRASLLENSWPGLRSKPPQHIRVEVADAPGDLQKRRRQERNETFRNCGIAIAIIMAIVGGFVLLVRGV